MFFFVIGVIQIRDDDDDDDDDADKRHVSNYLSEINIFNKF